MLKKTFFTLTGGRPMKEVEFYFTDKNSNQPVYRFQDGLGRYWMAHGKWSKHRIAASNTTSPQ